MKLFVHCSEQGDIIPGWPKKKVQEKRKFVISPVN
jgi:hypothetical protein